MEYHYCWRCKKRMPFLDEAEWAKIEIFLSVSLVEMMRYGKGHPRFDGPASQTFEALTGVASIPRHIIRHHRLKDSGPICDNCGHLLRTAHATFCANCKNCTSIQ